MSKEARVSGETPRSGEPILPVANPGGDGEFAAKPKPQIPAALYVVGWISISSSVIMFNKYILTNLGFHYPIILTTYHLGLATVLTQIMARFTTILDGRHKVKMTPHVYTRAIVPIGITFSLSLIAGNLTYLYLSVAFIQMLKATTPVAVLLSGWLVGVSRPDIKVFINVSAIVVGVVLASVGEVDFVLTGVLLQIAGVTFEALRLTLVQKILSSEYKMDALVSIYYYAPVCAVLNFIVALVFEIPYVTLAEFKNVGFFAFALNGMIAFGLNFAAVALIGKTSAVVLTLCGVLKDILLVGASMLIWGTVVTPLQAFGYAIALGGIVYYKLGYTAVMGIFTDIGHHWNRNPLVRRILFAALAFVALFFLLQGFSGSASTQNAGSMGNMDKAGQAGM